MRTQNEIDNEQRWTQFAALCLLIAFCFGVIGYGYVAVLARLAGPATRDAEPLAHLIAAGATTVCVLPGIVLWRALRSRNKYAALYGLIVAAVVSILVSLLVGVSPGSAPAGV